MFRCFACDNLGKLRRLRRRRHAWDLSISARKRQRCARVRQSQKCFLERGGGGGFRADLGARIPRCVVACTFPFHLNVGIFYDQQLAVTYQ
jgi:hypothetical protein